ncbi:TilS substrate-binding domain-containing protein [Bifidobacterium sp. SO1]|nr:TilS substrate-binding domain-containing protein [Bifidobacterium sp. SO1]MBW3078011.1 TilS substrate-binding domain-containing protein [Bifidobacterium simiiventris]
MTREDTTGVCEDLGLQWWDDPTNGDGLARCHLDRSVAERRDLSEETSEQISRLTAFARNDSVKAAFARNDGVKAAFARNDGVKASSDANLPLRSRIRHGLMPLLVQFTGSDVVSHLADGARLMRRDKDYLDMQADRAAAQAVLDPEPEDAVRLSVAALQSEHPAIRLRVIAHALGAANVAATATQIESIDRLIADWHGQSAVNLPRGYSAFRQKHVIRVCQDGAHANRRRPE